MGNVSNDQIFQLPYSIQRKLHPDEKPQVQKMRYTVPKYMIEARGKTLFEWSMISLTDCKERTARYIFIALDDNDNDVETFISEKCRDLGIVNYYTIFCDSPYNFC